MASKVAISNYALTRLGETTISSLTENTNQAIRCNTIFEEVAKQVMAENIFSSTIRRAELAQTTTTPVFGYDYEYQLPTDPLCIRVLNIDTSLYGDAKYTIEGDKLLTDIAAVNVRYIGYLTNSEEYGPYLTKAIMYKLTAELALSSTANQSAAATYAQMYEAYVKQLRAADRTQMGPRHNDASPLTDIR